MENKVIIITLFSIAFLYVICYEVIKDKRKKKFEQKINELKQWKAHDEIMLNKNVFCDNLEVNEDGRVELLAWDDESIYVKGKKKNVITRLDLDTVDFNHTFIWRKNYERAKEFMTEEPVFSFNEKRKKKEKNAIISENQDETNSFEYDGKKIIISELSEHNTLFYYKEALKNQTYAIAAILKKQLKEKFHREII